MLTKDKVIITGRFSENAAIRIRPEGSGFVAVLRLNSPAQDSVFEASEVPYKPSALKQMLENPHSVYSAHDRDVMERALVALKGAEIAAAKKHEASVSLELQP